jgi:uncharacterized membrane protein YesL
MVRHYALTMWDFQGADLVHLDVRWWRHDLIGGVVFGIPPFVLVVVEVV